MGRVCTALAFFALATPASATTLTTPPQTRVERTLIARHLDTIARDHNADWWFVDSCRRPSPRLYWCLVTLQFGPHIHVHLFEVRKHPGETLVCAEPWGCHEVKVTAEKP